MTSYYEINKKLTYIQHKGKIKVIFWSHKLNLRTGIQLEAMHNLNINEELSISVHPVYTKVRYAIQ